MVRNRPSIIRCVVATASAIGGAFLVIGQSGRTSADARASRHDSAIAARDGADAAPAFPAIAEVIAPELLWLHDGLSVVGGYGSALAVDPRAPREFYLLSDRGPNVDTTEANHIAFLIPGFAPRIGRFRLEGDSLRQMDVVELKDSEGRPLSGLPRKPGLGGTGEVPEDAAGHVLQTDANGIDPEGLVAMPDGSFWISEEYGPSLLHVDATGRTMERIDPYGPPGRALPQVLRLRWPNRGLEGLTITPDGKSLVAIMESPLDNPSKDVRKKSRVTRLLWFLIATGTTRQFAYVLDEPGVGNSDIPALSNTSFLVLERDKKRPGDEPEPSKVKRVYRIDLREATDVSDPADAPAGRMVEGKTLEQLTEDELRAAGIHPVTKTLVVDLLALPGGYPHDKPEGLAVIGDRLLAISNDNDFGVDDDGKGNIVPKTLPSADNAVDRTQIYFIYLDHPLR